MKAIYSSLFLMGALTISCSPTNGTEWDLTPSPDAGSDVAAVVNTCPYNVTKGSPNAWLLTTAEMHFIFWGTPWEDTLINTYQKNWTNLLNGTVLQRLDEYGIQNGSLDSNYYTITPTNSLLLNPELGDGGTPDYTLWSDYGVGPELNSEILAGNIPLPNDNTLYMIMLPPGTETYDMFHDNWAGYHAWYTYNGQRYAYALIGYRGTADDQISAQDEVISHELGESATDPDTTTGWRDYTANQEIADICVWQPTTVDGLVVQKYFINTLCVCQ
jgi:hypothetical protein